MAAACMLSGLAGVWLERIVKSNADVPLMLRNIQLGAISLVLSAALIFANDGAAVLAGRPLRRRAAGLLRVEGGHPLLRVGDLVLDRLDLVVGVHRRALLRLLALDERRRGDATSPMIFLAAVYYGAMYGGAISSVALGIPGASTAVATAAATRDAMSRACVCPRTVSNRSSAMC